MSRIWEPDTDAQRDLKAAVGEVKRYQGHHQRTLNELEAKLASAWPGITDHLELTGACLPALLAELPGPRAVHDHRDRAVELLRKVGRNFLAEETVDAVIASASSTLGTSLTRIEENILRALAEDAYALREKLERAKELARELAEASPSATAMSSTTGRYTAAALVASVGEVQKYPHVGAYVKAMGLNLRERSSGEKRGVLSIAKRGPSEARRVLYLLAMRIVRTDAVVGAWYARKVARDGGKKQKALTAVMRKLAKALWYVGRGDAFDAKKLFDVRLLDLSAAKPVEVW